MSNLAEAMKILYQRGEIDEEYVNSKSYLTAEEKEYVLSDEPIVENTYENAYKILKGELQ